MPNPTDKEIQAVKDRTIVERIRRARKALSQARKEPCTCTGFVIQYQGCSCGKLREINTTKAQLRAAINQA